MVDVVLVVVFVVIVVVIVVVVVVVVDVGVVVVAVVVVLLCQLGSFSSFHKSLDRYCSHLARYFIVKCKMSIVLQKEPL